MQFVSIDAANEQFVEKIFAGELAQYWVHYNSYWLENSHKYPDITAQLIYGDDEKLPVGFIAYGQHYTDEALSKKKSGCYELIHLVIDEKYQGTGYGRIATNKAIALLKQIKDCQVIVIAHHPDNKIARSLYESLGFVEIGKKYDDDPLLQLRVK
jgi:RimJ/RimL family protein N-acetyltransferase